MSNQKFNKILQNIEVDWVEAEKWKGLFSVRINFDVIKRLRFKIIYKGNKNGIFICNWYKRDAQERISFELIQGYNFLGGYSLAEKQSKQLFERVIEHKDIRLLWLLGEI